MIRWLNRIWWRDRIVARLLRQRDSSRAAGDALAIAVTRKPNSEDLSTALRAYCEAEGWNGPAGSFAKASR